MSNKLPMVSLEKVEVKLTMKAEIVVAVDKAAKLIGQSRASIINGYVEDGLKKSKIRLDTSDLARVQEIKDANLAKRNALKAKKGAR